MNTNRLANPLSQKGSGFFISLFAYDCYHQLSGTTIITIFAEVDTLPCAKIQVSISKRTSGSAFSLMLSPPLELVRFACKELVCFVKMFTIPVFGSMGNWLRISLVAKWKPLRFGFRMISICCTISFIP